MLFTVYFFLSYSCFLFSERNMFLSFVISREKTGFFLQLQNVRKRLSLITYTFIVFFMSSITLLIYSLAAGQPLFPYPTQDWVYFILLALIPNLLGHTLFNWSLKWLRLARPFRWRYYSSQSEPHFSPTSY